MPQKKNAQRRQGRKAKVQQSRNRKQISGLTSFQVGFPDRFKIRHAYGTYQVSGALAASGVYTYSFRGNSVYDPDFSGVGTTAFSYTQCSALYNRYRVIASKLTFELIDTGTTPLQVVLTASISNSPPGAWPQIVGGRHIAKGAVATGGPINWDHTASATTAKIFGVPNSQVMSEDDFAGLVGSNPNNVWYWHISVWNTGSVAGNFVYSVRIEYDTFWSMPLPLVP